MHLFKNSVSFLAIMCVCGAAFAVAPGRVGVNAVASTATRRLPSLSNLVKTPVSTATSTSTSSSSNLYEDSECIDKYRECMKGDNACGSDFSECTTNVLFHGHMSECFSTLYQCSAGGINSLFGTSNISALSNVDSYVDGTDNTEVARYTYPTDGSVMGIDIIGAATRNKLSTANCVKKYKSCLAKDNVCGEDFELCTSGDEFKKQAAMCDSTLSRCQKEGFQQLFGDAQTVKPVGNKLKATAGDVAKWIEDGASLAATNAVNTCYKVTDTCFLNACAKNPYRCVEGVNFNTIAAADFVAELTSNSSNTNNASSNSSSSDVRKFFRAACQDTIGTNKYCQITFLGRMPTKSELNGEDRQDLIEDIFDQAYTTRNKRDILGAKFTDLIQKFDTSAKNKCIDTFKTCAVRSCGGGSGAACYAAVFSDSENNSENNSLHSINNKSSVYNDIQEGCSAVINTDANCKYMAATMSESNNVYNYTFSDSDVFKTLFPDSNTEPGSTPVVDALNAELKTAYNDVAIAQMKKQCQNLVENCAKSMCGKDFQNCYRHRSDVKLSAYSSGEAKFDKSMNKIGGVLDYTIVQGLCASTIRNSDTCAESLAITKLGISSGKADVTAGWGSKNTTLTNAWRNSASLATGDGMVNDVDTNGHRRCECENDVIDICADESGATNMTCTTPHRVTRSVLLENQAVATLFQDVLAIVEAEAQAQYKAKLTKEQNVCWAQNNVHGDDDMDAFVWAKLTGKLPTNYAVKGLGEKSKPSKEVYDSFCRVNVSLRSSDIYIQDYFAKNASNAYFAANDAFTCGSWLSSDVIDKISAKVAEAKTGTNADGDRTSEQKWGAAGIGILSMVAGGVGTDLLQTKTGLGGFLGTTKYKETKTVDKDIQECVDLADKVSQKANVIKDANTSTTEEQINELNSAINSLRSKYVSLISTLGIKEKAWPTSKFNKGNMRACTSSSGSCTGGNAGNADTIASSAVSISNECIGFNNGSEYKDKELASKDKAGRIVTDIVGAGITSAASWVATSKIQRAKNKREFTEAQQEWMKEIGSKIQCYVGNEYVGDFGDTISLDITED